MLIDSHQHVFWHGRDDRGLIADMDEQGIDYAWLLSWEIPRTEDARVYHPALNPEHIRPDGTHPGLVFHDQLVARRAYPTRFVLGYCPDPMLDSAPDLFHSAVRIHGVRICGEWKCRMLIDDPRSLQLFRRAGELGCPVVLHLDAPYLPDAASGAPTYQPMWYGGTVANLERALKACPDTTFIGHAPGFWREISGDANRCPDAYPAGPVTPDGRIYGLLERYPNLYADLSAGSALRALSRDPAHARGFLTSFSERLLFARDYYGGELREFLDTLDLPVDVWENISYRNAQTLAGAP